MESEELCSALGTIDRSIRFLLLFFLGLLLSLHAVLLQRRQLCLTIEGADPSSVPSPYPFQHASSAISLAGLGFFYQLARQTYRSAQEGEDDRSTCLAWWNLLATALLLIAAAIRLWTLEQGQGRAADSLIREENEELPA